ncbi:MAG: SusC/RagA family TonB-linked outer membrane protein, partial [Bacteroidetes bacterium]|nr:SusC/RagA family TonB-linked outer membrane protein [Bacteroidota bacterium]
MKRVHAKIRIALFIIVLPSLSWSNEVVGNRNSFSSPDDPSDRTQLQEQSTISGTVTDENNSGMPGVNVIEKGTSNGVTTDASGQYRI